MLYSMVYFNLPIVKQVFYMKKINLLIKGLIIGGILGLLIFPRIVSGRCVEQYGGGEICYEGEISLDKVVRHPEEDKYVDNLYANNATYSPNQEVIFKLTIKNTGEDDLYDIEVKDFLPDYLYFTSTPDGWDDKTATWKIDHLSPGESKTYELKAKVVTENDLPEGDGTYCVTNSGEAKKDDKSAGDTSQLCISNKVLGMTTIPKTGNNLIWTIILLISALIFGVFKLRKEYLKTK